MSTSTQSTVSRWALVGHGVFADSFGCLTLREFPCLIGRRTGVTLQISHLTVSGTHAEIKFTDGQLILTDLGSRNGTFINGKRAREHEVLHEGDLVQFGEVVFRLNREWSHSQSITPSASDVCDLALALAQFDKLMSDQAFSSYYQPIVTSERNVRVIAYEALARSRLFGLTSPLMMFKAAGYFNLESELSTLLRSNALDLVAGRGSPHLFLNTHPAELKDLGKLVLSLREIRRLHPTPLITLEIHEAAIADITSIRMLRLALRDMNMGLAYDDFGAGQARFSELIEARPDYLKFDMKFIRGIHQAPASRQQLLATLVKMANDLGIIALAEGVETEPEAEVGRQMGFGLFQGYLFGRPEPAATWFEPSHDAASPSVS
jgi:EAL domain-containing protein (putative c-di-GMP-specific phosphodiesterase class I)